MKSTIDMAHKAGFKEHNGLIYVTTINDDCAKELERFADLVRADERERVMNEPLTKANWQRFEDEIRADEREHFFTPEEARVALEDTDFTWHQVVTQGMVDKLKAIRERSANAGARGETK